MLKRGKENLIVGPCGALGALLESGGEAAKEMLIRIPGTSAIETKPAHLQDTIVIFLDKMCSGADNYSQDAKSRISLVKLMCHWCIGCPAAVKTLLSKPETVCIFDLLEGSEKGVVGENFEGNNPLLALQQSFAALLIGIWLEYLGQGEHSGWSRSTLLALIRKRIGLSNFTKLLEHPRQISSTIFALGFSSNEMELEYIKDWYSKTVDDVRRRIVTEVTGGEDDDGKVDFEEDGLNAVVKQQSSEIRQLKLLLSTEKISSKKLRGVAKKWQERALKANEGDVFVNDIGDDTEIDNNESDIREAKEREAEKEEMTRTIEQISQELKKTTELKESLENEVKSKVEREGVLETKLKKLKKNAKESSSWMKIAEARISDLSAANDQLKQKADFDEGEETQQLRNQIIVMEGEIARLSEEKSAQNQRTEGRLESIDLNTSTNHNDNNTVTGGEAEVLRAKIQELEIIASENSRKREKAEAVIKEFQVWGETAQKQMGEKETAIASLESELVELRKAADNNSTANTTELDDLRAQKDTAEAAIKEYQVWGETAQKQMGEKEAAITSLQVELKELKSASSAQINSLQNNMIAHQNKINNFSEASRKSEERSREAHASIKEQQTIIASLKSENERLKEASNSAQSEVESFNATIATLTSELTKLNEESVQKLEHEATIKDLTSATTDMRQTISELKRENQDLLDEREEQHRRNLQRDSDSNALEEKILSLEAHAREVQQMIQDKTDLLAKSEEKCSAAERTISEFQTWSANAQSELIDKEKKIAELSKIDAKAMQLQINELQSELTKSAASSREKIKDLDLKLRTAAEKVDTLDQTNSNLTFQVSTLQNQLNEKAVLLEQKNNDSSVSQRATEIATRALEEQIVKTRNEQMSERETIVAEREMRQKAEREVGQLRRDMEFLAKSSVDGVEEMLKKAREDERSTCEVRNRRDLEALKIHTKAVKDELDLAKERERLAEERLASESLRLSVMEREIHGLKSDEKYLVESRERMKERNEEGNAVLKTRISNLENERNEMSSEHLAEVRELRKHLQVEIKEKDALQRQMIDLQGEVETLKQANKGGQQQEEAEINRLRAEKSVLLKNAAEISSSMDTRVRKAVAAAAGKREAEMIAEREATKAANAQLRETQLLNMGQEKTIMELRKKIEENFAAGSEREKTELVGIGELRRERDLLKSEVMNMRENNNNGNGNFVGDITPRSELKLMATPMATPQNNNLAFAELTTLREDYHELESEHEDLLALLAQQEIEKGVLKKNLEVKLGEEALRKCMKDAEDVTVERFGQYIDI